MQYCNDDSWNVNVVYTALVEHLQSNLPVESTNGCIDTYSKCTVKGYTFNVSYCTAHSTRSRGVIIYIYIYGYGEKGGKKEWEGVRMHKIE